MFIRKIEIYGYGKWHDQTFELTNGINLFLGENEAGKTTLASFIHSVFYGFPTKQTSELRYEPKDSSRYGGKITVEHTKYGRVTIERTSGKATGNVTVQLEDGTEMPETFLSVLLYETRKDWYQSIFSFNLDGLANIKQMNKEKMNRFFISAGTMGSEKFLTEADRLEIEASKLYKPMGRIPVLNELLKQYEKSKQKIGMAKKQNAEYAELLEKRNELAKSYQEIEHEKERTEQELRILKELDTNWEQLSEIKELEQATKRKPELILPQDSVYKIDQLTDEIEKVKKKVLTIKEQQTQNRSLYQVPSQFIKYEEEKENLLRLEKELDLVFEWIHHLNRSHNELEKKIEAENGERIRLGLSATSPIPEKIAEKNKKELSELMLGQNKIAAKMENLEDELNYLNYKQQNLSEELDKAENELWLKEEYEEVKMYFEKNKSVASQTESETFRWKQSGFVVLFVLLTVASFLFLNGALQWILAAVGSIFTLFFIRKMYASKEKKHPQAKRSYEEFIRQTQVKSEWRKKLALLDGNEQMIQLKKQEIVEEMKQRTEIQNKMIEWKRVMHLPESVSYEEVLLKDPFEQISQLHQERQKLQKEYQNWKNQLDEWVIKVGKYEVPVNYFGNYTDFYKKLRTYFENMHEVEKQQQRYLYKEERIRELLGDLVQQEQNLFEQKMHLLTQAQVKTEQEFRQKFHTQQLYFENKKKYELLKERFKEEELLLSRLSSKKELQMSIHGNINLLEQLNKELKNKQGTQISIEATLQKLEENGEYSVLLQNHENIKSEIQEKAAQWASYKIAASLIEKTLHYAKKDKLPDTIRLTEEYFNLLTDGVYTKVKVTSDTIKVYKNDGTLFLPSELSRGTAEQLYTAFRLGFIVNIAEKIPLPVLIDDGFVNFDAERKMEVWEILKQVSRQVQILYFSFESPEESVLAESNLIRL